MRRTVGPDENAICEPGGNSTSISPKSNADVMSWYIVSWMTNTFDIKTFLISELVCILYITFLKKTIERRK
jgi:hypothetical protein